MKKILKKNHSLLPFPCQTALVQDLLSKGILKSNNIFNSSRYRARTCFGTFKGTDIHYYTILTVLQHRLDRAASRGKQEQIRSAITAIEDGYQGERIVRQWYAVPHALAAGLIAKGYVVLVQNDLCWLGN